jgi:hypothetical protein
LIPKLFGVMEQERVESPVRGECIAALRRIDPQNITAAGLPALRAALENNDRQVRFEAASLLGRLGQHAPPDSPDPDEFPAAEPLGTEPLEPGQRDRGS